MPDVRFGSKADICTAIGHVRLTPNSDRKSGHPVVASVRASGANESSCAFAAFSAIAGLTQTTMHNASHAAIFIGDAPIVRSVARLAT